MGKVVQKQKIPLVSQARFNVGVKKLTFASLKMNIRIFWMMMHSKKIDSGQFQLKFIEIIKNVRMMFVSHDKYLVFHLM